MKIKIYDSLGFLLHITEMEHPLTKVLVWGSKVFIKAGKRQYRQVAHRVLADTSDESLRDHD